MKTDKGNQIARLNDQFRTTFLGGKVVMTAGIGALCDGLKAKIFSSVQSFSAFNPDNDPYGEHDFGALEIKGHRVFWKVDYYDLSYSAGSENPSDPSVTGRLLTIMLADEY